jgi:hypothetical protein
MFSVLGPEERRRIAGLIFITRAIFVTDCGGRVMLAEAMQRSIRRRRRPAMSGGGGTGGTDY